MDELVKTIYVCPTCGRVVEFFEGFVITHKDEDSHAFTVTGRVMELP